MGNGLEYLASLAGLLFLENSPPISSLGQEAQPWVLCPGAEVRMRCHPCPQEMQPRETGLILWEEVISKPVTPSTGVSLVYPGEITGGGRHKDLPVRVRGEERKNSFPKCKVFQLD